MRAYGTISEPFHVTPAIHKNALFRGHGRLLPHARHSATSGPLRNVQVVQNHGGGTGLGLRHALHSFASSAFRLVQAAHVHGYLPHLHRYFSVSTGRGLSRSHDGQRHMGFT